MCPNATGFLSHSNQLSLRCLQVRKDPLKLVSEERMGEKRRICSSELQRSLVPLGRHSIIIAVAISLSIRGHQLCPTVKSPALSAKNTSPISFHAGLLFATPERLLTIHPSTCIRSIENTPKSQFKTPITSHSRKISPPGNHSPSPRSHLEIEPPSPSQRSLLSK